MECQDTEIPLRKKKKKRSVDQKNVVSLVSFIICYKLEFCDGNKLGNTHKSTDREPANKILSYISSISWTIVTVLQISYFHKLFFSYFRNSTFLLLLLLGILLHFLHYLSLFVLLAIVFHDLLTRGLFCLQFIPLYFA